MLFYILGAVRCLIILIVIYLRTVPLGYSILLCVCVSSVRHWVFWALQEPLDVFCTFNIGADMEVLWRLSLLGVRGSVRHSIVHIKNPTRCNSISKFYFIVIWSSEFYFIVMWSSMCFGPHAAHHQEPKTALAASGFARVEGCWTCSC